jgi:hypothetical protein
MSSQGSKTTPVIQIQLISTEVKFYAVGKLSFMRSLGFLFYSHHVYAKKGIIIRYNGIQTCGSGCHLNDLAHLLLPNSSIGLIQGFLGAFIIVKIFACWASANLKLAMSHAVGQDTVIPKPVCVSFYLIIMHLLVCKR